MPRETRRSMKRKAEEKAVEKATRTTTSQPMPPSTKLGQASDVIARYFGFQGVPRRFTKPSSDNESTSSLQSCPASSDDEYEEEEEEGEEDINEIPFKPVLQRQESPESSSLATERLTKTPEARQEEPSSHSAPRKRRKTMSEAGTMSTSESQHDSPPTRFQKQPNDIDTTELSPQPSPPPLLLSFRLVNRLSPDLRHQAKPSEDSSAKPSTRSLSPDLSRSPRGHQSQPSERAQSMPHYRTKSSPAPDPELPRTYLLNKADALVPRVSINESLAEDQPQTLTLSSNGTSRTRYQISPLNTPASQDHGLSSSRSDSALEQVNLVNVPSVSESPSPSYMESVAPMLLPTTEACFEPRTSPVCELDIQGPASSQTATSSEQPEVIPVQDGSDSRATTTVARVRHSATKKRTLLAGSKEERAALVALYVQEDGELKTIKNALFYLSNSRLNRGVQETERLLRILGQAEDNGEVTLRVLHKKRVKEIKERDAQVGDQTREHSGSDGSQHQNLPEAFASNEGVGAVTVDLPAEDNNGSIDVPMVDAGDMGQADVARGVQYKRQEATKIQIAGDDEHTEDIIYVQAGLRPTRHPVASVKQPAARKVKKNKAENTSGRWAYHSCVRCRVGLLDEINDEGMEEATTD